jgi:hypothetical protein
MIKFFFFLKKKKELLVLGPFTTTNINILPTGVTAKYKQLVTINAMPTRCGSSK